MIENICKFSIHFIKEPEKFNDNKLGSIYGEKCPNFCFINLYYTCKGREKFYIDESGKERKSNNKSDKKDFKKIFEENIIVRDNYSYCFIVR